MRCSSCGASMTVQSSSHGRRRFFYFICAAYDHRGRTVCAILTKLSTYLLYADIVEGAIVDAVQELQPSRERDRRGQARRPPEGDPKAGREEQARYVAAITAADQVDALARALQEGEQQRTRLQHDLAALDGTAG